MVSWYRKQLAQAPEPSTSPAGVTRRLLFSIFVIILIVKIFRDKDIGVHLGKIVMNLQKNQVIPLEITSMSHMGEGVGRSECGIVVFVPMSAVGDFLQVRVVKVLSNRAYGIIESIDTPSPDRAENDCPVYRICGGCSMRHISPAAELRVKEGFVRESLKRIGGFSLELEPAIDSPCYERCRNKASYPVRNVNVNVNVNGKVTSGLYARRSHRLVEVSDCLLQPAFFADITACVCSFCDEFGVSAYDEENHSGVLRHIVIRVAEKTGQVMVCLVINAAKLPHAEILTGRLCSVCPEIKTIVVDYNTQKTNVITGGRQSVIFGGGAIEDEICGIKVELSAGSFYQVNRDVAEMMYNTALEYAAPKKSDILLDMYCGTGTIGLSMAHAVKEVIGIEISQRAVRDARKTAQRSNIENVRFICADAAEAVGMLAHENTRPDIIIIDPPRAGTDKAVLTNIGNMAPAKIVYISCNPATLARDVAYLAEYGYTPTKGRAANMFARTSHVESVVLLVRGG